MRRALFALALLLVAVTPPLPAQTTEAVLSGFRTPSGNIHCQSFAIGADRATEIRCDLLRTAGRPVKRPADCELEYGNAFSLRSRGRTARPCVGDTVADPDLPLLPYGGTWSEPGIACDLSQVRLRCRNADGHAFELSWRRQRLR